jgi:nucleolar protein 53
MPVIKPLNLAPGAPQQYKQPSRKGKKAWRKNVDVTEIQDGLEEVRDELIKGYVLIKLCTGCS